MKFVFFGTPEFAEIVLRKMIGGGCKPDVVICNPDRPFGRRKTITSPKTKILAKEYGIEVWQPERLDFENFEKKVDGIDFAVVAAYAKIIPQQIVDFPRLGTIGVHPSLLPKYRGPSPIQTVILNGEHETGVTLFKMDKEIDHGPILAQRKTIIGAHENYLQLEKRLAELGGDLLAETLPDFHGGKVKIKIQDERLKTLTQKYETQDAFVESADLELAQNGDLERATLIHRKVRAFVFEPGAWSVIEGRRTRILETDIVGRKLKIKKVQVDGGKPRIIASSAN